MQMIDWNNRKYHYELKPELVLNIVDKLDLNPKDNLLDIGCGDGQLTKALIPFVKTAVGTEVVAELADRKQPFPIILTDSTKLPFKDNQFDKIICHCSA